MGRVISINNPDAERMSDPATRADLYLAEALRFVGAAREAVSQVEDKSERIANRAHFLVIANEAIEATVDD